MDISTGDVDDVEEAQERQRLEDRQQRRAGGESASPGGSQKKKAADNFWSVEGDADQSMTLSGSDLSSKSDTDGSGRLTKHIDAEGSSLIRPNAGGAVDAKLSKSGVNSKVSDQSEP